MLAPARADVMQGDLARVGAVAVLDEIDGLPDAKRRLAAGDRHAEAHGRQHRADVPRHVVGAFHAVAIAGVARRQLVERVGEVAQHVGICS